MEIEDCNAARQAKVVTQARIHSVSIDSDGLGHIELSPFPLSEVEKEQAKKRLGDSVEITHCFGYEPRKTPLEEFLDDMQARIDRMRGEA